MTTFLHVLLSIHLVLCGILVCLLGAWIIFTLIKFFIDLRKEYLSKDKNKD